MAKATSSVEIPAALRPVLHAAAKNLLHHLYGPDGPPWGTSFAQVEDLAAQIGRSLGTELLQQALQRQAGQPVPAPLLACPVCGRPTTAGPPEPRSVRTEQGTADWQEPSSHCEHCRKAFFPPVAPPRD